MTTSMFDRDGRPLHVAWTYNRAEIVADGIVHALGILFGLVGGAVLVTLAAIYARGGEVAAVALYACSLLGLMSVSAAYNLWPVSRTKWWLRRFDHALIFVLIAGTYTPFLTRLGGVAGGVLMAGVWGVAVAGGAAKIALPGRFDRLSIALCLMLGASGVVAWEPLAAALPTSTLVLMVSGALVYAVGVIFHVWDGLRFQNAVWHSFVLAASALFYSAVLDGVVFA